MQLKLNKTYIHMNGLALGLGLKRRLRVTRKWAIRIRHFHIIHNALCVPQNILYEHCF